MEPDIPTFCTYEDSARVYLGFLLGLLPYLSVDFESLPAPFMTKDYMQMKLKQAADSDSYKNKAFIYVFIATITLVNYTANPVVSHLNKRGVLTSYWVMNHEEDINYVLNETDVSGVMSDRP